jgi:hypothetical protein
VIRRCSRPHSAGTTVWPAGGSNLMRP